MMHPKAIDDSSSFKNSVLRALLSRGKIELPTDAAVFMIMQKFPQYKYDEIYEMPAHLVGKLMQYLAAISEYEQIEMKRSEKGGSSGDNSIYMHKSQMWYEQDEN